MQTGRNAFHVPNKHAEFRDRLSLQSVAGTVGLLEVIRTIQGLPDEQFSGPQNEMDGYRQGKENVKRRKGSVRRNECRCAATFLNLLSHCIYVILRDRSSHLASRFIGRRIGKRRGSGGRVRERLSAHCRTALRPSLSLAHTRAHPAANKSPVVLAAAGPPAIITS
jgi:hypothetical protein